MHEDAYERGAGNEIADYGGFALNEAGRLWALSYDPSRVTLRHHQCEGYVAPYQMRSTGNFRIWEERDPRTQRLIAIYVYGQTTEGLRTIWMDGRPHPPAWAPHTARGFSTGRFVGNALVVQTTHIKQGWVRRNGLPGSDQTTMTDFFLRNGDRLTNVTVANDPVFFSEPQVRSNDFVRQPVDHGAWLYACDDGEQILDRAPDYVPHYLFGKQPFAREFAKKYNLPLAASLMGAASIYPELPAQLAHRQRRRAVLAGAGPALGDQPGGRCRAARRAGARAADPQQRLHAGRRRRQHRGADRRSGAVRRRHRRRQAVRQGAGGDPHADAQADPVHRQHELPRRAHRRQRRARAPRARTRACRAPSSSSRRRAA